MVSEQDTKLPDAERLQLLKESLNVIDLAQNAYVTTNATPPDGWKIIASSDLPEPQGDKGFFARVYERTGPLQPGQTQYAVAFRGTDRLTDVSDLVTDAEIAARELPGQCNEALKFVQRVCRQNGIENPAEMTFTGHSLGGYLAVAVGTELGAKHIVTFDSPGPTQKIRDKLIDAIPHISAPPGSGLKQIYSIYDIISTWGFNQGIRIGVPTAVDHHGLDSLKQSITDITEGKPVTPPPGFRQGRLAAIFNALDKRSALSRTVGAVIRHLVNNDRHHRGPS